MKKKICARELYGEFAFTNKVTKLHVENRELLLG